jgi:glycosyltransferase involved in cell wall biosynthesis
LIVVEANKSGAEHASFNSAMLAALLAGARSADSTVLICCERSHRRALQPSLRENGNTAWRDIPVVSGLDRNFVRKWLVETTVLFKILLEARRTGATVVLLSTFANALVSLLLLRRLFKAVPVHVILHAEVEALIIKRKQKIYREGFWIKRALFDLYDGKWPMLYVLGNGLKDRLVQRFPKQSTFQAIRAIAHPYRFEDRRVTAVTGEKIAIGFIGAGRRVKGIFEFFDLAASLADYSRNGRLEFVVVGGIEKELRLERRADVAVLAERPAGLGSEEFKSAIKGLSCAVFPYQENYRFTASGAVLDAINAGVEIFTLENFYFRDLAERDSEGGIKFFSSLEQMRAEIARRIDAGVGFARFSYPQIRREHMWTAVSKELEPRIFSTTVGPTC